MESFTINKSSLHPNSLISLDSQKEQHPVIMNFLTEICNIISILEKKKSKLNMVKALDLSIHWKYSGQKNMLTDTTE